MAAEERINVLLSRARNAMILIGNANTFQNAKKGKSAWKVLFDSLREKGHFYDGLPVKCERHPDRVALLRSPQDFNSFAPDGGCSEPWCVFLVRLVKSLNKPVCTAESSSHADTNARRSATGSRITRR
jgi:hypothetical protein